MEEGILVTVHPTKEKERIEPPQQYRFMYVSVYVIPNEKLNLHVARSSHCEIMSILERSWKIKSEAFEVHFEDPKRTNVLKAMFVIFDEKGRLKKTGKKADHGGSLQDRVLFTVKQKVVDDDNSNIGNGSYYLKAVQTSPIDADFTAIQPSRMDDNTDRSFSFTLVEYEGHIQIPNDSNPHPIRLLMIKNSDGKYIYTTSSTTNVTFLLKLKDNEGLQPEYTNVALMDSRFFLHVAPTDHQSVRLLQPVAHKSNVIAMGDSMNIVLQPIEQKYLADLSADDVKRITNDSNKWVFRQCSE